MFTIVQVRLCPALMVPVASDVPGVCIQPPSKLGVTNPMGTSSCIVKEPGPNVTALVCPSIRENEDGVTGLFPVTVMGNITFGHGSEQSLTMFKFPSLVVLQLYYPQDM
jgi:hypothetical protein